MSMSGIDTSHLKAAVRPQDDLYRHVNGAWLDSFVIPPDRSSDGAFRELFDRAEAQVRAIVEESDPAAPGNPGLIGRLYASFMDEARVEEAGSDPLACDLVRVQGADTRAELAEVLGELQRSGVGGALESYVDTDPADPERYVVFTAQSGLGLPDESYYRDEKYEEIREQYVTHIASMFALAGLPQSGERPAEVAARVMDVETTLARGHWDVVRDRDDTQTFNPMSFEELERQAPGFAWARWLTGLGAPNGALNDLVVREPSYATHLAEVWSQLELERLREWVTWRVLGARAPFLSAGFVAENFQFYGRALNGTEQLRERWKRGVSLVEGVLGEAVGSVYVARHFPPQSKARLERLVGNLIAAYRESISQLEWMGSQTRERALEKLAQFTPKIGYPARWRDYSALELVEHDLMANVRAANAFEQDFQLAKIGRPVDRDEWFMTPQTVNAYYNPGMNEIVFPAAILQPPFFDAEADDAANYGGIGAVIGHEIGHGFDDQGSKYDGTGRMVDWWTEADLAEFEARTKALISQYDEFVPTGLTSEHHVNGALTIGENIGDLGGLAIAIKAYRIALDGQDGPEIDGLTALQRIFFGWAQCWRTAIRDEQAIVRLATDPHSPAEFRCNGVVRNIPEFYEAFAVTESDALYLAPDKRVTIW